MEQDGTRRRAVVAALLAGTAVLAPVSAYAGYTAAQGLRGEQEPTVAAPPTPPASPSPTASASPAASAVPSGPPTALSPAARRLAQQATVRLSPPSGYYSGSGSIVSADGLVLTNAHVARPTAPGLAALYGSRDRPQLDPERLVVSTTEGDGPARPAYLADVLALDGHLDLAVLRINALADGGPLPAGLTFPFVELGSVAELELGDDLTVYGFPGLNGGDRLTVRTGIVSSFLPDTSGRVAGNRYRLETSADFSGGNSGGMALSNDGRLVGVPSATKVEKEELDEAHYVRPVDLAAPLIAAARAGTEYRSPYLVAATGRESATDLGWASKNTCSGEGSDVVEPGADGVWGRFVLQGMAPQEDVLLVLETAEGVERAVARWYDQTDTCMTVRLPVDEAKQVRGGQHVLEVFVGPERRSVLTSEVEVDVE